MKSRSDIDPTRLLERLISKFEKTPTGEMQELVRLFCDQGAISYEQREKLAELARACVARIADLGNSPRRTKSREKYREFRIFEVDPGAGAAQSRRDHCAF
jgi:hypothetical protein